MSFPKDNKPEDSYEPASQALISFIGRLDHVDRPEDSCSDNFLATSFSKCRSAHHHHTNSHMALIHLEEQSISEILKTEELYEELVEKDILTSNRNTPEPTPSTFRIPASEDEAQQHSSSCGRERKLKRSKRIYNLAAVAASDELEKTASPSSPFPVKEIVFKPGDRDPGLLLPLSGLANCAEMNAMLFKHFLPCGEAKAESSPVSSGSEALTGNRNRNLESSQLALSRALSLFA